MGWTYTCCACTCMYIDCSNPKLAVARGSGGGAGQREAEPKRCDKCQRATNDEARMNEPVADRLPTTTDN